MMGSQQVEQGALFYNFSLDGHVPADHLLHGRESPIAPKSDIAPGRHCARSRRSAPAIKRTSAMDLTKARLRTMADLRTTVPKCLG